MALLDWILVAFGAAVALTGAWIVLRPERVLPRLTGSEWRERKLDLELDSSALRQIRRLGACFVFMGMFFGAQMTVDLMHLPWWIGTGSGLPVAIASVLMVNARARKQQRSRRPVRQSPLPAKALELR